MMVFQDLQLRKVNKVKNYILLLFLAFLLQALLSNSADAQYAGSLKKARDRVHYLQEKMRQSPEGKEPLFFLNGLHTGNNPHLKSQLDLEAIYGKDVSIGYRYTPDIEPSFPQIQFYQMPPVQTLHDRIDKLLYGIKVSIPQEYDLYGYELRRYMSRVAGAHALGNKRQLLVEITNTKNAKIMLDHWQDTINQQINDIEIEISNHEDIDPALRTSFKLNRAIVKAFFVEARLWVRNNQEMLQMLYDLDNRYQYQVPAINFGRKEELDRFANLFRTRQKSVQVMHKYPPFRMMIY